MSQAIIVDDIQYEVQYLPDELKALVVKHDVWNSEVHRYSLEAEKAEFARRAVSELLVNSVRKHAAQKLSEMMKAKKDSETEVQEDPQ